MSDRFTKSDQQRHRANLKELYNRPRVMETLLALHRQSHRDTDSTAVRNRDPVMETWVALQ